MAPDADNFAQRFAAEFGDYARAHLGGPAGSHWGEGIDLAAADADAARRLFFELFDGFCQTVRPAGIDTVGVAVASEVAVDADLPELLRQWRDEPGSRPGDGSIAAAGEHLREWLHQRQARSQGTPFEADFHRHFDDWLRHHARRGKGSWSQQLARISPDEAPFATLLRLALSLRQRIVEVGDRNHPAYGDQVVPD